MDFIKGFLLLLLLPAFLLADNKEMERFDRWMRQFPSSDKSLAMAMSVLEQSLGKEGGKKPISTLDLDPEMKKKIQDLWEAKFKDESDEVKKEKKKEIEKGILFSHLKEVVEKVENDKESKLAALLSLETEKRSFSGKSDSEHLLKLIGRHLKVTDKLPDALAELLKGLRSEKEKEEMKNAPVTLEEADKLFPRLKSIDTQKGLKILADMMGHFDKLLPEDRGSTRLTPYHLSWVEIDQSRQDKNVERATPEQRLQQLIQWRKELADKLDKFPKMAPGTGPSYSKGGRGSGSGSFSSGTAPRRQMEKFALSKEDDLQCLKSAREEGIPQTEIRLPGSRCAATPIRLENEPEAAVCQNGKKIETIATAYHCLHGKPSPEGQVIQINTAGHNKEPQFANALVVSVHLPNGEQGEPVARNNPDMVTMNLYMDCSNDTKPLKRMRIPTEQEVSSLSGKDFTMFIAQNRETNVSATGKNKGIIVGQASFEGDSNGNGLGHYARFSSLSDNNNRSWEDEHQNPWRGGDHQKPEDSARIKQGDSGGSSAFCKVKNGKPEFVYLGAISNMVVRGEKIGSQMIYDKYQGQEGSIASGQSLINLRKMLKGQSQMLTSAPVEPEQSVAQFAPKSMTHVK